MRETHPLVYAYLLVRPYTNDWVRLDPQMNSDEQCGGESLYIANEVRRQSEEGNEDGVMNKKHGWMFIHIQRCQPS